MVHLSKTQKMDGIRSWSLPALSTCPGARNRDGSIVPVCQGCYAREGRYKWSSIAMVREANRVAWMAEGWVNEMVQKINALRKPFFRWFDSGDIYHPRLAEKIRDVIEQTPGVRHWIPTRSYKVPRIKAVLDQIDQLPNVVVRYSADEIDRPLNTDHPSSLVVRSAKTLPEGAVLCTAYKSSPARCNGCRACWDPSIPLIAYPAHGREIQKVIASSPSGDVASIEGLQEIQNKEVA